jgi:hypothetical protein
MPDSRSNAVIPFWNLKWQVHDALLMRFDPSRLNLVQLHLRPVRRFIRSLIRERCQALDGASEDCLISEIVKEFFTERPLIKATVLPTGRSPFRE